MGEKKRGFENKFKDLRHIHGEEIDKKIKELRTKDLKHIHCNGDEQSISVCWKVKIKERMQLENSFSRMTLFVMKDLNHKP